jgi:phenylalanyl-tRNA synthetase beta chain
VRFEKGVDAQLPEIASARYEQLLTTYIKNTKYEGGFAHETPKVPTQITLTHAYIEDRIGTKVSEKIVLDTLTRLGFNINQNKSEYIVTVPSWRDTGDISISADLVEEVARMVGYDTLPISPLPGPILTAKNYAHDEVTTKVSHFFANHGYFDAYTYPFTLAERFARFSDKKPAVIHNTSENRTHLRANLAENLLELVAGNYRTHTEGKFFEFGPIFDGEESLQGMGVIW